MNEPTAEKAALREQQLAIRAALSPAHRAHASQAIAAHALLLPWVVAGAVVACFVGVRDEVDTAPLRAGLLARGCVVLLPRIAPNRVLTFHAQRDEGDLLPGKMGIPVAGGPRFDGPVDLALVPGLAFDARGGRLGYGGGYYDRWTTRVQPTRVIGVAFAAQRVASVPMGPYDRRIGGLVTELGYEEWPSGEGGG